MQLDDHGRMWSAYDVNREAQCFQLDTCSGGLGSVEDGVGHCFKWAMGPDAPALPWSATLIHPKPAADVPPPGDIQASFGEQNLDCEGNDGDECFTDPVRLAADAPIRSQPVETAPIAASIPAGECVWQARVRVLATPLRGVVLETTSTLSAGDVIYLLAFQGEHMVLWHKEKLSGAYSPTEIVARWDSADRQPDATDSWVELTRADGKTGWARNPGNTGEECNIPGR